MSLDTLNRTVLVGYHRYHCMLCPLRLQFVLCSVVENRVLQLQVHKSWWLSSAAKSWVHKWGSDWVMTTGFYHKTQVFVCLFVYWGFRLHTKRKWLTGGLTQNTWASESTISYFMRQGALSKESTFAYATFSMIWPWASALLEAMTACLRNGGPVWERPQPHHQYSAALCHLRGLAEEQDAGERHKSMATGREGHQKPTVALGCCPPFWSDWRWPSRTKGTWTGSCTCKSKLCGYCFKSCLWLKAIPLLMKTEP